MPHAQAQIKQLEDLTASGKFEEALALCEQELASHPTCAPLYYWKALVLLRDPLHGGHSSFSGDTLKKLLIQATELDPHYSQPHKLWAQTVQDLWGRLDWAEVAYTRAVEADPADWEAYAGRAEIRKQLGNFQGAVEDFTTLLNAGEGGQRAYALRAGARLALKDYPGALEDYAKAIELEPGYCGGFFGRGQCKAALTDYAGALEEYCKAIALFPQEASFYVARGDAKLLLGDLAGALADFQQALQLAPNDERALRAVRGLQDKILSGLPEGTPVLHVTLTDGRKAVQVPVNGQMVTLLELAPSQKEAAASAPAGNSCRPKAEDASAIEQGKLLLQECLRGHVDKVRELIAAGADLNVEICGETPLLKAVMSGEEEIVRMLLEVGADVNAVSKTGESALKVAAERAQTYVLQAVLAAAGIKINAVGPNGDTALIAAAKCGKLKSVQMLLEAGADVNVKNYLGQSALDLALAGRHAEMAELLKSADAKE